MRFLKFAAFAMAFLLAMGIGSDTFAQGRSGGSRGNSGAGAGRPTTNPGVNRGIDTSSSNSNGRSDTGRNTASEKSNGRYDDGIDRARNGGNNANMPSDNELNRYRGIARKLNTTPEALRAQYEAALATNPDLKFGQFVAANMIADNLNSRNSNITTSAILAGLQNDKSIGQTLQDLGLSSSEAKDIEKKTKHEIKNSKKQKD